MKTLHRILGVVLVLLFLSGCVAVPMYDPNGNYQGPQLAIDSERMADMGTGAVVGGLFGIAAGNPLGGAALGAGMGGMMHGYNNYYAPPPIYYPPRVYSYQPRYAPAPRVYELRRAPEPRFPSVRQEIRIEIREYSRGR